MRLVRLDFVLGRVRGRGGDGRDIGVRHGSCRGDEGRLCRRGDGGGRICEAPGHERAAGIEAAAAITSEDGIVAPDGAETMAIVPAAVVGEMGGSMRLLVRSMMELLENREWGGTWDQGWKGDVTGGWGRYALCSLADEPVHRCMSPTSMSSIYFVAHGPRPPHLQ